MFSEMQIKRHNSALLERSRLCIKMGACAGLLNKFEVEPVVCTCLHHWVCCQFRSGFLVYCLRNISQRNAFQYECNLGKPLSVWEKPCHLSIVQIAFDPLIPSTLFQTGALQHLSRPYIFLFPVRSKFPSELDVADICHHRLYFFQAGAHVCRESAKVVINYWKVYDRIYYSDLG